MNPEINCDGLSSSEINYKVKEIIFNGAKYVILKNTNNKNKLLEDLKNTVKVEIIGDAGANLGCNITGPKIIVNGNIGENSASNITNSKIIVFGSCGNGFGNNLKNGELYVLENCGSNSFSNISKDSKIVIGGQVNGAFAFENMEGVLIILNLQGGNLFIDNFNPNKGIMYVRGDKNKIKNTNEKLFLEDANADDDIYLPMISEFARLFKFSLSEIKSKQFYRIREK